MKDQDGLLNQFTTVLNKNCDTDETDASTSLKRDNSSLSPIDSKDTQTEMVLAEKGAISPIIS